LADKRHGARPLRRVAFVSISGFALRHLAVKLSQTAEMTVSSNLNDQFRRLFEAAPNGVMAIDAAGCIIQLNAQIEKMFGYSRAELIGPSVEVLVPTRLRQGHFGLRKKFAVAPEMRLLGTNRDLIGMRKDGSEFAIEVGLNSMATSMGDVVVAAIVDITELVESLFGLAPAEARVAC
jgi:PAS domain S-box-containing protein